MDKLRKEMLEILVYFADARYFDFPNDHADEMHAVDTAILAVLDGIRTSNAIQEVMGKWRRSGAHELFFEQVIDALKAQIRN